MIKLSDSGLDSTSSMPLILKSLDLNWIIPPAFLELQLADGRSWEFSISIIA
jgi:hypothetical protein